MQKIKYDISNKYQKKFQIQKTNTEFEINLHNT